MKKSALIIPVLLLVIVSCATNADVRSTEFITENYEVWSEDSPLYSIVYDKESGTFSSDCSYVVFIEKQPGKDFVILNLADIQLANYELYANSPKFIRFNKIINTLVSEVSPDLITHTGDFGDKLNSTASLKKVSEVIDSFDIPWAAALGNHDNEGPSVKRKAEFLENCSNSLFKIGPANLACLEYYFIKTDVPNLGNYIINIVEKDDSYSGYKLVNSLIFMNTGSNSYTPKSSVRKNRLGVFTFADYWGYLSDKQIQWYRWAVESAKAVNSDVKSTLFIHIPIFEYSNAAKAALPEKRYNYDKITLEESYNPSEWNAGYEDSFGVMHENGGIACPKYNDFVFDAIIDEGSTNLVICGHDHVNNTVITYDGVTLAYSMKTGSGEYWESGMSGGTVITIGENGTSIKHILCNGD